jgi:hypothetical protein
VIKVFITVCFLNPVGYWDNCTTYTSTDEVKTKAECQDKIDKFIELVESYVLVPYRVKGKCSKLKGENI